MKFTKYALALWAVCFLATTASAAVIVNDTWIDGTDDDPASPVYSEQGVDSDGDGDIESVWYQGGGGTLNPVGPGGPLRAEMAGGSSSWTTYFTSEASPITLNNTGDRIRLTWNFTTGDVNESNTSQNFRFALLDSSTRLTDNGSPAGNATGYAIFGNMGETLGHNDSFELVQRIGQGAILSGSGDWSTGAPLGDAGTNGNPGYTDDTAYSLVWEITRNASGNHDITVSMTGGNLDGTGSLVATATDVAPNGGSHSFDTFTLRPSSAVTTSTLFDTSLFRVEFFAIPEPASLALVGMSVLALALRRSR